MRIQFKNTGYTVSDIQYDIDENEFPIKVVARGDENVLYELANECTGTFNVHKLSKEDQLKYDATHEANYEKMNDFRIKDFHSVHIVK